MKYSNTKSILITGGTGLLGTLLTKELQRQGHHVSILSRNPDRVKNVKAFYWDVDKQEIDKKCVEGVNVIVHLAGEGIANKKWTKNRKKALVESRVNSIELLYKLIAEKSSTIDSIISASAVGFYGDRGEEILVEESPIGTGFLAECCGQWEEAVEKGTKLGLRVVKFRIGLLLTQRGGVLEPFKMMVNRYAAMSFGSGSQWFPWVHADDLVEMFSWAISENQVAGVFNASAPTPVRNNEFTKELAKVLKKPFWPIRIPRILLKIVLGERSELLLMSDHTSALKIQDRGFKFKYTLLNKALEDITSKKS